MSTTMCDKELIKLSISDQSSWYVKILIEDHNRPLAESCGENTHLSSKYRHTPKKIIKYLIENNTTLSRVNGNLGSVVSKSIRLHLTHKQKKLYLQDLKP